jgi:hypothetical protein
MSEESRLGREQIETSYVLKQIIDAGGRLAMRRSRRVCLETAAAGVRPRRGHTDSTVSLTAVGSTFAPRA